MPSLLKLQIGPVQEFIAQARTTRDLWSGSYLLSWLVVAGLKELVDTLSRQTGDPTGDPVESVIFPNLKHLPLYGFRQNPAARGGDGVLGKILTPNVPNLLVAVIPGSVEAATTLAGGVERAIEREWEAIWRAVWGRLTKDGIVDPGLATVFEHQCGAFLSVTWQVTPWDESYARTSKINGWELDAVRQTREFDGWSTGRWEAGAGCQKDSLTGREEAICGGKDWWSSRVAIASEFWTTAFRERQSGELYGAVTLVKRLWYRTYLNESPWNLKVHRVLPMPSTSQMAAGRPERDEADDDEQGRDHERYFAVLAMDGDDMGRWLGGDKGLPVSADAHRTFSRDLSRFALEEAGPVVESHQGRIVYAGGDDVLALLPAQTAIACARELRNRFRAVMDREIEASTGIAIAHYKAPLQDVVRAARAAEKCAKTPPKGALSVSLLKRSGEITEWTCRWSDRALDLYLAVDTALAGGQVSARFSHRLVERLAPYRTDSTRLGDAPDFDPVRVIELEFQEVLDRQRTEKSTPEQVASLSELATGLLSQFKNPTICIPVNPPTASPPGLSWVNRPLAAFVGLAQTVAFAHRNRNPG